MKLFIASIMLAMSTIVSAAITPNLDKPLLLKEIKTQIELEISPKTILSDGIDSGYDRDLMVSLLIAAGVDPVTFLEAPASGNISFAGFGVTRAATLSGGGSRAVSRN